MDTARKCLISLVIVAGALQWSIIGERFFAALWAWYKYSAPYSGGGHITVGVKTQVAFYLMSAIFLGIAGWAMPTQPRWRALARFSMVFIGGGAVIWTVMLLSSLVTFRRQPGAALELADPGRPFQASDALTAGFPFRRLVFAGLRPDACFIYYQPGGTTYPRFCLAVMHYAAGRAYWVGQSGVEARRVGPF